MYIGNGGESGQLDGDEVLFLLDIIQCISSTP